MSSFNRFDVVVVGGGIAGIMSALWAQAAGKKVALLERAPYCGGLLRSHRNEQGLAFDYGTHIPAMTGVAAIDGLLYGPQLSIDWIKFNKLRKGNYFQNKLNVSSQFPDITTLPAEEYKTALVEMLNTLTTDVNATNLDEALRLQFGNYLTNQVFIPLLKRFYKNPLNNIHRQGHRFLEYNRVVGANSEVSKEIKKSVIYDEKFAFSHYADGGAEATYLYPRNGGCGTWIEALVNRFTMMSGKIFLETSIQELDTSTNQLKLGDNSMIKFEQLIWTGPIGVLAKLLIPEAIACPPEFVPTRLYHFTMSMKPKCDCHYVYINDPSMSMFRVTLYSNITHNEDDNRVTVETVDKHGVANSEAILAELKKASIYDPDCKMLSESNELLPFGFPEITIDNMQINIDTQKNLQQFSQILIGGRGSAEAFFMNDVLKDIAIKLEQQYGAPNV